MQGGYIRQERPYVTFAALFVSEKRDKGKVSLCFFTGRRGADPYKIKPQVPSIAKRKNQMLFSLFLLLMPPQKKSYQKENAKWRFRALRSATKAPRF